MVAGKPISIRVLTFVMAIAITAIGQVAFCAEPGYTLMIQQSPANAGTISPEVGVYRPSVNDMVTLNALPNTGYRFLYWLGDVVDSSENRTMVKVDAPKIIIAVFERNGNELEMSSSASGPGRSGTAARRQRGGGGSVSRLPPPQPPPLPPIPEPSSITILGLGGLWLMRRVKKRKYPHTKFDREKYSENPG